MAYQCELGSGQSVYLDQQGTQTTVTTHSRGPGQQQQASQTFQTGLWTAPPELFQTPQGVVIRLSTAQGAYFLQIRGNSLQVMSDVPFCSSSQQMQVQHIASPSVSPPIPAMQPLPPMKPMQPMKMGNMQMSIHPMEMQMGNMHMQMGEAPALTTPPVTGTRRFCSQCGGAVDPSDRFCSSCGHRLSDVN
jgi:hypothetical protein